LIMKRNIFIKTIFDVEGQIDAIRVSADCDYIYTPEQQTINYDESTEDGLVPTCITAVPDCVDIVRNSPEMPDMHMKLSDVVSSDIQTPYGSIPITTTTKRVDVALTEDGGTITLEYVIDIGGAESKNTVYIMIN